MRKRFSVVTLVNDDALYETSQRTLAAQDVRDELVFLPVQADVHGWNAATALNYGIESAEVEWVICAHQDVLFPLGWLERFRARLGELSTDVAVVGLVGRTRNGEFAGHVLDPHGHTLWGTLPRQVVSIDEHFIAIRRDTQLRFDPLNPGFHVYGADLCQTAAAKCLRSMAIDCPVVHLSGGKRDDAFDRAAEWLLDKWGKDTAYLIPLTTDSICRPTIANTWRRWVTVANQRRALHRRWRCHCQEVLLANEHLKPALIARNPILERLGV